MVSMVHSFQDYPHPEESCISVYLLGCEHNCKHCSNLDLQEYKDDKYSISDIFYEIEKMADKWRTNNICLLGGDPFYPPNILRTFSLISALKNKKYNLCVYTGYELDFLKEEYNIHLLPFNYLKTGTYIEDIKQESGKTDNKITFASTNQKLFDKNLALLSNKGVYYFNKGE